MLKGPYLVKLGRPLPITAHEVLVAVHQNNLDHLEDLLMERSDPGNSLYQQWLSFDEVGMLTRDEPAFNKTIEWLQGGGAEVTWTSPRLDYIRATASIQVWEAMLNTEFYTWNDTRKSPDDQLVNRAETYSVPADLADSITAIFQTVQITPVIHHNAKNKMETAFQAEAKKNLQTSYVTVSFLDTLYKIPSNIGKSSS
jgi:subtilase family serine protease